MSRFDTEFNAFLKETSQKAMERVLVASNPSIGMGVERRGRQLINFSSNDYLGLSKHPLLIERSREWASKYGAGSGASRLVTGTYDLHLAVEERLARFKGCEAALIMASGWQANAGIIPAILRAFSNNKLRVLSDRLNHASLHHGCAAAGIRQYRFRHNDLAHLEELLGHARRDGVHPLILTESVFSMDGDRADAVRLSQLAHQYNAFLYLDEAHATAVLGPEGRGLAFGQPVDLVMGTFSKGMGGFGAYVAGSKTLCDYLVNTCGSFIYSTALPPAVLGAIDAALDLVPKLNDERARLQHLGQYVRTTLNAVGIDTGASSTQIIPAIIGDAEAALSFSHALDEAGILATAIRPPTVPNGTSRIRITLSAAHSDSDIEKLTQEIVRLWQDHVKEH